MNINKQIKCVVALGKFDGVHIGHQKLINTALDIAKEKNLKSLVYTIVSDGYKSLTTNENKENIMKSLGVDFVYKQQLTEEFRVLTPEMFVKNIIVDKLNAEHIVVGYNFHFGINRSGNTETLMELCKKYNIGITVIENVMIQDENNNNLSVSSTRIRALLENGKLEEAKQCLGRYFCMWGCVQEGKHFGRTIGFPTVNIYPKGNALVPKHGVYAAKLYIGSKEYNAITNVGVNPTVENEKNIKVESYIFDYSGDELYQKDIRIKFIEFIRPEIKFDDITLLKSQIETDKNYVKSKITFKKSI